MRDGDEANAALIRRIAEQPVGEWIGPDDPRGATQDFTEAAENADRDALLVLYNIPHRDCGQFSRGGAADGDAYRTWLESVAQGIGDRRATVILEPDALLHLVDGCTPREFHEERYDLLRGAVQRLKQQPNATVYVDAGNAGWQTPDALDEPLRRAGIAGADGFAVNVSNFRTTEDSTDFGKRLSAKVGGKPFVIDTSRNGNGPYEGATPRRPGATHRGGHWANRRRRTRATSWWTRTCGSSGRGSRTATARAGRRRGTGTRSTHWTWPAPRSRAPDAGPPRRVRSGRDGTGPHRVSRRRR